MSNILTDNNLEELTELVKSINQPVFRAKQLYEWINNGTKFAEMGNIPSVMRDILSQNYIDSPIKVVDSLTSVDGSVKYIYELSDGEIIEGVFLPNKYGNTICISTQVGCRMGCNFCASGIGGLVRNLTAGEILSQFIVVDRLQGGTAKKRAISNIVLMGSGEPFDNYDNVVKFIRLISDSRGINMSVRNISVSTCGLEPEIRRFADEGLGVTLSLSLHATTPIARQKLMPIANKYSIGQVIGAMKYYFKKTGRRVVFEYSLVKESNMKEADAKRLYEFTKGLPCHINLIMLNPVKEKKIRGCSKGEASDFLKQLTDLGCSATLRRSYGSDIGGACGQLRRKYVKN